MASNGVQVFPLQDRSDELGNRFRLTDVWRSFLGEVADIRVSTLHPGHTRGSHYHKVSREAFIVAYSDKWSLYYDAGPDTRVTRQQFQGKGAVLVLVDCMATHGIVNDGAADLSLVAIFNRLDDTEHPDSFPRRIM